MMGKAEHINIAELQKMILPLQGYKSLRLRDHHVDLGPINEAFPRSEFPVGIVHEFLSARPEDSAATFGFISGLLSGFMTKCGAVLFVSTSRKLFPPALETFGVAGEKIIFIDVKKEKDVLWIIEEGLKCKGLAGVIGEVREFNFTSSRRLQLAVENSNVNGFIVRKPTRNINTTACITRWRIRPCNSIPIDDLPGLGLPCWNVDLLKVRNGKPGSWQIFWKDGKFHHVIPAESRIIEFKKKTG